MPTLRLVADVYSPHFEKIIKYNGDHPSKVLKIIPPLIKIVFRITSTKFYEDEIKWDSSTDLIDFYGQWRGKDEKDARTAIWIKVKILGKQNKNDKKGWVEIHIHPYMITKIPYTSILEKILAKPYSHFFYGVQRKKYISRELIHLQRFENEIKDQLGLK